MSALPARPYAPGRSTSAARSWGAPQPVAPQPRRRDHLRPVASPAPARSLAPIVWLCLSIMGLALALMLVLNTAMTQGAYERRDIKLDMIGLERERASLVAALETHDAPHHLAEAAAALGMVPAERLGYVSLTKEHANVADGVSR